ncbi:MAG TPA: helix-turn-helix domain-containing protein [Chloroflexota bacterium]|jgi:hypothetical protein|nr:helix-turn-helix domain-containing protein [Chloroflexota bacterium]
MPTRSACDALIDEVARRFRLKGNLLRTSDRRRHIVDARHAAYWALHQAGLAPLPIAQLFGVHHSTVAHALARVDRHPEWQALAAPAVALATGGPRQALEAWLERGLRGLRPEYRRAVHAYAVCTLAGWERRSGATCALGLMVVLWHPPARAALEEALRQCGLGRLRGCIDLHARQIGYRTT